jgi:hypothetical protein
MKLMGRMVVVVAMMIGSLSAAGCAQPANAGPAQQDQAPAQAQPAATAPQAATPAATSPANVATVANVAPFAPPPVRYENPGTAPSADFVFVPGFWRWQGRTYQWVVGHWAARRDADDCVRAHYVLVDGHWVNRPERFGDRRDGDRRDADRRDGDRRDADRHDGDRHDHRAPYRIGSPVRSLAPIPRGHG